MKQKALDKNTTFGELLRMSPDVGRFLLERFRLGCVGCGGAEHETLAQGATAHGLDVDELLTELRKIL